MTELVKAIQNLDPVARRVVNSWLRVKFTNSELKFNSKLVLIARKPVSANSELNWELNED